MYDSNTFVAWLKTTFGDAWLASYKAAPANTYETMYYNMNQLAGKTPFEEVFCGVSSAIISSLGIAIDELSATPQIVYAGSIYKTDSQIMKLATKINELSGLNTNDIRGILMEMVNAKKNSNQNPTFDKSLLLNELNDIFAHEAITLDFATMDYVRIVGKDSEGADIYSTINPTEMQTVITVNQSAKKLNTDNGVDGKILLSMLEYNKVETKRLQLEELIESVKHNPADADFADKYLDVMYDAMMIKEDREIFRTLMKHFAWQIKRRSMERRTYNDIMISFFGNQGVGKSYVVNNIFGSIFKKFYNASISLDNLMDERWTVALNSQFIMNIEEMDAGKMGNISGKNLAMIKKVITGSEATYRPMHTNTTQTVKIKTSFISNANFHIYDIINDESGMRRFFEFNLAVARGSRIDSTKVSKLVEHAGRFFSSINEALERGYWDTTNEVGVKITAIQESYIKKPAIVEFCEQLEVVNDMGYSDCIAFETLYDQYTAYCIDQGVKDQYRVSKKNFRRKMEDILDGCSKMHGNIWRFKVKFKHIESDVKDLNRPSFFKYGELE